MKNTVIKIKGEINFKACSDCPFNEDDTYCMLRHCEINIPDNPNWSDKKAEEVYRNWKSDECPIIEIKTEEA